MFIGSWIINIIFGFGAFLLVFIGSMTTNTISTSIIRGMLAFVFFYVIIYFFRWLWMLAFKDVFVEDKEIQIENSKQGNITNKSDYTEEDITKASEYIKDLINE